MTIPGECVSGRLVRERLPKSVCPGASGASAWEACPRDYVRRHLSGQLGRPGAVAPGHRLLEAAQKMGVVPVRWAAARSGSPLVRLALTQRGRSENKLGSCVMQGGHAGHAGQARSPEGTGRSLYKTWRPR